MNLLKSFMFVAVLFSIIPVYAKDKRKKPQKEEQRRAKRQAEIAKERAKLAKLEAVKQPVVKQSVVKQPVIKQPVVKPAVVQPAILPSVKTPVVVRPKLSMDAYLANKVSGLQDNLISDLFQKDTIERIVLDFKDEYPGPNKEADTALIYQTIIQKPAIKSTITLENATRIYKFLRETIDNVWTKQDELIWAS